MKLTFLDKLYEHQRNGLSSGPNEKPINARQCLDVISNQRFFGRHERQMDVETTLRCKKETMSLILSKFLN